MDCRTEFSHQVSHGFLVKVAAAACRFGICVILRNLDVYK